MSKGILQVADRYAGDLVYEWDTECEETVATAQELFNKALADGKTLVFANGHRAGGEVVDHFVPTAERIYAVRPLAGG